MHLSRQCITSQLIRRPISPTTCLPASPAILSSKQEYIDALAKDKGQFLPDGLMPKGGPETVLAVEKAAGKINGEVNLPATYTDEFAIEANKTEGYTK